MLVVLLGTCVFFYCGYIEMKNMRLDGEEHEVWLNVIRKEKKKARFKKVNLVSSVTICVFVFIVLQNVAELHIQYRFKSMDDVQYDFWTNIANQYDFDHNGEIDPFELGCMLQAIGSTLSDHDIEQLLANGPIQISDLPAYMKRTKGATCIIYDCY